MGAIMRKLSILFLLAFCGQSQAMLRTIVQKCKTFSVPVRQLRSIAPYTLGGSAARRIGVQRVLSSDSWETLRELAKKSNLTQKQLETHSTNRLNQEGISTLYERSENFEKLKWEIRKLKDEIYLLKIKF